MCVAIYKPAEMRLDEETLFKCYLENTDGCGFSYINVEKEIIIYKTMEYDEFLTAYKEAQEICPTSPFLIHFRIATHGTVDIFNCHPFDIDKEHVFIHNGVLRNVPDCPEKKMSDTQVFNENILKKLPENWFHNPGIKLLLEDFIGFSKMVVLNKEGEALILNESKGKWIDGVWFSNDLWDRTYSGIWGNSARSSSSLTGYSTYTQWCWNCGKDMPTGGYKKHSHYCSWKCEQEDNDSSKTCINCGCKYAYMSAQVDGKGEYYSYCSWKCRDDHAVKVKKERNKATDKKDNVAMIYVQCLYCAAHKPITESFEVTFEVEGSEDGTIKEYVCVDCLDDAIKAGLIEESEELLEMACTILTERDGGIL